MAEGKTDFALNIEDVPEEDLSRVWAALSRVGQGFVLEGYRVELETWKDTEGDGLEEHRVLLGPPERSET